MTRDGVSALPGVRIVTASTCQQGVGTEEDGRRARGLSSREGGVS